MMSPVAAMPPSCFAPMRPTVVLCRMSFTRYCVCTFSGKTVFASGGLVPSSTTMISCRICSGVLVKTARTVFSAYSPSPAQGRTTDSVSGFQASARAPFAADLTRLNVPRKPVGGAPSSEALMPSGSMSLLPPNSSPAGASTSVAAMPALQRTIHHTCSTQSTTSRIRAGALRHGSCFFARFPKTRCRSFGISTGVSKAERRNGIHMAKPNARLMGGTNHMRHVRMVYFGTELDFSAFAMWPVRFPKPPCFQSS
mmetsp:Transcript_91383/g.158561  ORF Transcript_91383/g.158561 Transcript_91383/m.158561 type:complete len:254 (-) Transcript_91383:20-781(-)